ESGMLMVPGVRAEVTFYKGLFDKLGIHAEMLQVGDFKGAAEPYTRQRMSPAFRKQYETLLDDFYEQMIESIAADRKLDPAKVRQLVDTGLFTPAQAKDAGLIDRVAYQDETPGRLRELLNAEKVDIIDNYGKKKVDTDFSGMLGMVKLFELLMGVEPAKRSTNNRKLAVVYASGTIVTGESGVSLMGGESLGSDTIIKALRKCSEDKSVVAIVLRIDSPGGSALASDLMWREIQRIEKPVIASMGDVAASGGYYIAMGCDKIYAEPGTLTGSIGVVGGKLSIQGLTEKLGVNTEIISRGKNSGILSMETPFTESERQVWQDSMREIYRQFTTKAAAGRKLPLDKLEQLAGGRVWTGRQAKANGLVDELGTLRDALQAAKKAAGIAEEEKLEIMSLPEPKNFLDQLLGSGAGASSRLADSLEAAADSAPALKHLDEIRQLRRLFSEPGVLLMPAKIRVN
ncbi:MAG TPA: signal peptide peptidase SppA, partial [Pirellulaceae bacterium]|nr:signal peptide peptidase SppA [Pirellulaceae bacterium]